MPTSEFTGQPADTSSEDWRHECEVRWLLDELTLEQRRAYVNGVIERSGGRDIVTAKGVRQKRGAEAAEKIINDLRKLNALRLARKTAQPAA